MTDKTPQNKADIPVKTPTARAGTTDATRNSGPESRALPEAGALKDRFKAGSIPLQTDFADLIDLANMGRQAVGGAEGQTGPADGFTLSSIGRLELKPNTDKGISVDKDGVAVKVNTSNGLKMTSSGIAINDGLGIEFSSTGQLNIKVKKDGGFSGGPGGAYVIPGEGITTGSSGVGVKAGNGIAVTSSGVNVKLAKGANTNGGGGHGTDGATSGSGGGLNLTANGLSVDAGDGMQINTRGVSIKLAANSGLSADEDNGLKIVSEQMFQKGMVMMFAGTEAEMPKGWALCDGNEGRPDLRDRFVLGSTGFTNVNKNNNKKVTGDDINKKFVASTDNATPKINVTVNGCVLSTEQIPAHNHLGGMRSSLYASNESYNVELTAEYGSKTTDGRTPDKGYPLASIRVLTKSHSFEGTQLYTSNTGGAKSHDHKASATQDAHNHSINVVPPYYILAFIIKL